MTQDELIDNLPEWEKKSKEGILCANGRKMEIEKGRIRGEVRGEDKLFNFREGKYLVLT